jgi:hypothetical protein
MRLFKGRGKGIPNRGSNHSSRSDFLKFGQTGHGGFEIPVVAIETLVWSRKILLDESEKL